MTVHARSLAACLAALVITGVGVRLTAQAQPHQGQMHAQAMQQQPMMAAQQMMRNADIMMSNAATMMRNLAIVPPNMPHQQHQQHQQMMQSLDGMLQHMRQFHGTVQLHLHDPALMNHRQAFRDMEEACRNLEQMAGAFEAMTKHMNQALKSLPNVPKK
jgi:hypothetical protein